MNARLTARAEARIARCAELGPAAVEQRPCELDREWGVERALEANFAAVVFTGVALGTLSELEATR